MDHIQLFRVDLSSPQAFSDFLSLLVPYIPQSLPVLRNLFQANKDHNHDREHRPPEIQTHLWATFSFQTESPIPPLFSVISISTSDYQSRFFCSAESGADTATPQEERHVANVISGFQHTAIARRCSSSGMPIIIGSVHGKWARCVQELVSRISPCLKYLRHPQPVSGIESRDRFGCILSVLQSSDVDFVRERCHILRSREYLLSRFPSSVCLRIKSETYTPPVGWMVMHSDGSLGMLHVEPEFRRRGIAQMLVNELIRRTETDSAGELFGPSYLKVTDDQYLGCKGGTLGWHWVDVVENNGEGSRFFKSLEGWEEGWTSFWLYLKAEKNVDHSGHLEDIE